MTVRDIEDLSFPELEDLLEGLNKNAEREKAEIEGISDDNGGGEVNHKSMQDLLDLAIKGDGEF